MARRDGFRRHPGSENRFHRIGGTTKRGIEHGGNTRPPGSCHQELLVRATQAEESTDNAPYGATHLDRGTLRAEGEPGPHSKACPGEIDRQSTQIGSGALRSPRALRRG